MNFIDTKLHTNLKESIHFITILLKYIVQPKILTIMYYQDGYININTATNIAPS